MGWRYVFFRIKYELLRRSGLLKKRFPTDIKSQKWVKIDDWKKQKTIFFFDSKQNITLPRSAEAANILQEQVAPFEKGYLLFFSAEFKKVTDWLTNPDTGFRYDVSKHWTEIPDLSAEAGDIKYVWEKSRFAFIYTLIRYDYHAQQDMSEVVFGEIIDWIDANPVNCGPNWRCSQEISLRVLNWTFALNYYKNSSSLTESRFEKIIDAIYWHTQHVEANIDFSRIAVRNNHALTETLTLYLVGLLYPFFAESKHWKTIGKRWFEEEIEYQIYEDGTFLQFSMNYHRVVVQLLTWGIALAENNNERWADVVYDRAKKSLEFLRACQDQQTGWLPNYGNNDGALFFKLNDAHFRDYRPQLNALATVLGFDNTVGEDSDWYGLNGQSPRRTILISNDKTQNSELKTQNYPVGGYSVTHDADTLTFMRCGAYKDRPFQADNLHLDIWANGQNLLRDAGSYKYNTDDKWVNYFAGTASHNTVMLGHYDQMRRGGRFIWYDWVTEVVDHGPLVTGKKNENSVNTQYSTPDNQHLRLIFDGKIQAFKHVGQNIWHRRRVSKIEEKNYWQIEDWLENAPANLAMNQIWHPSYYCLENYTLTAFDQNNQPIQATQTEGWYSGLYGQKEATPRWVFSTTQRYIRTVFEKL
jgi:Heparinase II/III-like protein/Heparinase II/III N-terminus